MTSYRLFAIGFTDLYKNLYSMSFWVTEYQFELKIAKFILTKLMQSSKIKKKKSEII